MKIAATPLDTREIPGANISVVRRNHNLIFI
jgi:hypothetical protein